MWMCFSLLCCPSAAAARGCASSANYGRNSAYLPSHQLSTAGPLLPFVVLPPSLFDWPLPCRSALLVLKYSTEVAQLIGASKQQAHLFARKAPTFTAAAHDSKADLPAQAAGTSSQGVTAVEPASSQQQEEAQVDVPQATAIPALSLNSAIHSPPVAAPSPAVAAAVAIPSIKPRVLKPITMARGSSAILGHPKRPALAQPSSLVQTATTMGEAAKPADADVQSAPTLEPLQPHESVTAVDYASAGSLPVTTGATSPAAAATSVASPSVPAVEKPMSQKPSAMGCAFSKQSRPMPQIRAASNTIVGNMPRVALGQAHKGPQAQTALLERAGPSQAPDLAAVNRLRAQFTLPFATAPAEGPKPSAILGKRQQPEGQQPADQGTPTQESGTTGEGIRAVVDALQADTPSEATGAQQSNKRRKGRCCSCGMPKFVVTPSVPPPVPPSAPLPPEHHVFCAA